MLNILLVILPLVLIVILFWVSIALIKRNMKKELLKKQGPLDEVKKNDFDDSIPKSSLLD